MSVPVTELGPEALAERLRDYADLAGSSIDGLTYLNETARQMLRDVADRLVEIGKEIPRLRAALDAECEQKYEHIAEILDLEGKLAARNHLADELASARKALETIETRDRFWSAHPGSREVLEAARNGNKRIRGEYGNIAHAALTQPESKT